tara:strand:- start:150 stop:1172 length:1023 start_codon:yes stop_codon:yes gene_type:complete
MPSICSAIFSLCLGETEEAREALLGREDDELPPPPLTLAVLKEADDQSTGAILHAFRDDAAFKAFSTSEMEGIMQRDQEDDDKLAAGILMAVQKGVVEPIPPVEPLTSINVLGKTADAVASEIMRKLPSSGCVLVLQGLSGTGKGTTVAKLQSLLPRAVSWSNGNVFRSLTLLALAYCEQQGVKFSQSALTPQVLAKLTACLSFGKHNGEFDIRISGFGYDMLVSEVANTTLKEGKIGKNIPTVAKMTQGEVIKFAAGAAEAMRQDGMNVLMEGRAQTLNYVRTPHRFELMLSEPLIIGMRRAAQRMMGGVLTKLKGSEAMPSDSELKQMLVDELAALAA